MFQMFQPASRRNFATKLELGLLKLPLTQPQFSSHLQGFTLVEVLVAIMVTLIFISITMQMFVAAAFFRAKADQYNQAFNWIQEDFETTFNKASQYESDAQPYSTMCLATDPANGLAASFLNDATLGLGGSPATIGSKDFGGNTYTMTRSGTYANSDDPFKLLILTYTVTPADGEVAIANINTEIAIYAGFKCP